MKKTSTVLAIAAIVGIGAPAFAQDFGTQLKARQGQFNIMQINLGILGNMAQGRTEYDAEAAQAAADTLAAVSMIQQAPHWPEGSDNASIEGTRAQPNIWENLDDFVSKWGDFGTAAQSAQAVVGDGLEALGPAVGGIGGACQACHETYRAPAG